mmetsp:Transcript_13961/g.31652  ORF Transcript_13961/g.31652 Transcript_13961/m.31652 type:complete len:259 (+) Transcript_13961:506-1282(+)
MTCMSSLCMSRASHMSLKLALVSRASTSSSRLSSPSSFTSSSAQILTRCFSMASNFCEFSSACKRLSFFRASLAAFTITVRMRLSNPRLITTRAESRMIAKPGSSSMSGTLSLPQLSPARICCTKVRFACMTVEKARSQREQSPYTPLSASFTFTGCTNSTARMEQKVKSTANMQDAQNIVFIALKNACNIMWSSLKTTITLANRASRQSLKPRSRENTCTSSVAASLNIHSATSTAESEMTKDASMTFHLLSQNFLR